MDSKHHSVRPELKLKYYNRAKKIVQNRMNFYFHSSLYLTVNFMLFITNMVTYKGIIWFVWPLVFWGVGLVGHGIYVYVFIDVKSKNPMQSERFERKAAFFIHLIVYILTNLIFILCNAIATPDKLWAIYPILGWGIGLFYHFFFTFVFRGWKIKKWKHDKITQLMRKHFDIEPFDDEENSAGSHERR